ncbi:Uma2 family endonuclease [soil metagenome]
MSAVLELPEISEKSIALAIEERKHAVFFDVSWETYKSLLELYPTRHNPKLFYNQGVLELMPLPKHDFPVRLLDSIFYSLADYHKLDYVNFGSSTYHLEIFGRGFEPDSSYYINENAELMRGKERFDLTIDPPPDLIFEVDVTSPSISKFVMFAEFGIPEIWIYDKNQLKILHLENNNYSEGKESRILPKVTGEIITDFINKSRILPRPKLLERIHEWARQNLK